MVAVNSQYDSSGLLTWRQSTADITYKLFLKTHACLQFDTYGCISSHLLLRFVKSLFSSVTTLFGRLKSLFTLAKSLLEQQKVNQLLRGLSTSWVKHHHLLLSLTIKKGPFHRSFTPVEDVFSHNKFHAFTAASGN